MAKVTKAVIAAAGFGTRFLPQTKAMPKEMLPLVDKPIIQYVVEELVDAGIKDIIIVNGYSKRNIEDHFDYPNQDLVSTLKAGGPDKQQLLKEVEDIATLANFVYIRQKGPYGNATPVYNARHLLGDEPFIYTFADDFIVANPGRFKQMIQLHEEMGGSVLSCIQMSQDDEYNRYGVIDGKDVPGKTGVMKVSRLVEKPGKEQAPSNIASVSGYLLEPSILPYVERSLESRDPSKEFMIHTAMQQMMDEGHEFYGYQIPDSTYYDTGNKLEYLKTVIDFALKDPEMRDAVLAHMRSKIN
jgi:UTP--glucose-1-phosphate uridylyltransferase